MEKREIRFLDKLKQEHAERAGVVPGNRRGTVEEDFIEADPEDEEPPEPTFSEYIHNGVLMGRDDEGRGDFVYRSEWGGTGKSLGADEGREGRVSWTLRRLRL